MNFTETYLAEEVEILKKLDVDKIDKMASILAQTREQGGRLFFLGVGGSAANASHAASGTRHTNAWRPSRSQSSKRMAQENSSTVKSSSAEY